MLYWNTYRMEVLALGPDKTNIAAGCKGSVGDGSCYFDEFVRRISPDWEDSTTIGTELNPDVEATVSKLESSGYDYVTPQDKLFPSIFDGKTTQPFSKVLQAVGDSIEGCRKTLGGDEIIQQLDKARYSLDMVREVRLADQAKATVAGVNKMIAQQGKTFVSSSATSAPEPLEGVVRDDPRVRRSKAVDS